MLVLGRRLLAAAILGIGTTALATGAHLQLKNPRSNPEDDLSWCLLSVGASLIGMGVGVLLRAGPARTLALTVLTPGIGFALLLTLFWGCAILFAMLQLAIRG